MILYTQDKSRRYVDEYLLEERKHDASPICNCCSSEALVVLSFVKEASKKKL